MFINSLKETLIDMKETSDCECLVIGNSKSKLDWESMRSSQRDGLSTSY